MRRWEWREQVLLSQLLGKWLDPSCSFATAVDNVASSALSGFIRRKRGVVAGLPDNWVVFRGKLIGLELKSPSGKCSRAQREVRAAMLRSGCRWFECRTANAAMCALAESGVKFRTLIKADGSVECWKRPRLADWEQPRADPRHRLAAHPEIRAKRKRWRERQREREAAMPAAERSAELPARTMRPASIFRM
jgi:hypothetical protein